MARQRPLDRPAARPAELPGQALRPAGRARHPVLPRSRRHVESQRRPEPDVFTAWYLHDDPVSGHERIFVDSLPSQLRLEIQYALQQRCGERAGKAPAFIVMIMVRFLASSSTFSLLDRTEQEWRDASGKKRSNAAALVAWSRREVTDLAEGSGWDTEYPCDAWQMHRLGFESRDVLNFSPSAAAEGTGKTLDPMAAEHRPPPPARARTRRRAGPHGPDQQTRPRTRSPPPGHRQAVGPVRPLRRGPAGAVLARGTQRARRRRHLAGVSVAVKQPAQGNNSK